MSPTSEPKVLMNQISEVGPESFDSREVLINDESERIGLPAFKMLGASWASY